MYDTRVYVCEPVAKVSSCCSVYPVHREGALRAQPLNIDILSMAASTAKHRVSTHMEEAHKSEASQTTLAMHKLLVSVPLLLPCIQLQDRAPLSRIRPIDYPGTCDSMHAYLVARLSFYDSLHKHVLAGEKEPHPAGNPHTLIKAPGRIYAC